MESLLSLKFIFVSLTCPDVMAIFVTITTAVTYAHEISMLEKIMNLLSKDQIQFKVNFLSLLTIIGP